MPVRMYLGPALRALTFIAVIGLAFNANAGKYNQVMSIGDAMPSFTDLPTVAGGTISSDGLQTDIVVLVSMSNNCPFSRGVEDDLIEFVESVKDRSVKVVAMSFNRHKGDQMPAMREHAKAKNFNFTYLRDESQQLGRQLGTTVTPEFFVFNQDRKLVYMGLLHDSPPMDNGGKAVYTRGEPEEFYVAEAVKRTLKGKAVKVAETSPYGCSVEYIVDRYAK